VSYPPFDCTAIASPGDGPHGVVDLAAPKPGNCAPKPGNCAHLFGSGTARSAELDSRKAANQPTLPPTGDRRACKLVLFAFVTLVDFVRVECQSEDDIRREKIRGKRLGRARSRHRPIGKARHRESAIHAPRNRESAPSAKARSEGATGKALSGKRERGQCHWESTAADSTLGEGDAVDPALSFATKSSDVLSARAARPSRPSLIRTSWWRWRIGLFFVAMDLSALVTAWLIVPTGGNGWTLLGPVVATLLACAHFDLQRSRLELSVVEELPAYLLTAIACVVAVLGVAALRDGQTAVLGTDLLFGVVLFGLLTVSRAAAYGVARALRRSRANGTPQMTSMRRRRLTP
jgi:hypothetical protein